MAELTADDVEKYTRGRLAASDPETGKILARALAGARRYCGWVVTPPATGVQVTMDGPGMRILRLPTMYLSNITACTENDVVVDPATLRWSRDGFVKKRNGCRWTCELAGIAMTIDHGYVEADAEDWRGAVLAACDLAAQNVGQQMQEYTVDDVLRKWFKSPQFAYDLEVLGNYQLTGVA